MGTSSTPTTIHYLSREDADGCMIGKAATSKVGFYGATPVVQRASSVQVSSNIAVSSSFGATQLAVVQEIQNTLTGLGLWKGAA